MTRAPSLIDPIDDVLRRPPDEALMALRAAGRPGSIEPGGGSPTPRHLDADDRCDRQPVGRWLVHAPTSTRRDDRRDRRAASQASGGQRIQVPFAFTATASGQATVYLVPTGSGSGAYWHAATIHGL